MPLWEAPPAVHAAYTLQLGLGAVFLASVVPKLRHPRAATSTVREYRLVPLAVANVAAYALIAVESFLAVALLLGVLVTIALPVAAAMLLAFLAAVGINLRRGRQIPCGCFGNPQEQISTRTVVRLLVLLAGFMLLAAFVASGVRVVRVDVLISQGLAGLTYALQIASLAAFLGLATLWLLHLPELLVVLRLRGTQVHHPQPTATDREVV
jgi:hypothetical protein